MTTTGTQVFPNEEAMDDFLSGIAPGSTVVIKEDNTEWCATWFPGKNFSKSKYYPNGISADDGEIYWYSKEKLWTLIPAF
ncbi:MAG: hypothetical protein VX982_06285 [Chloroflexota bacterium]|nr:hypothetical protein [Chloroflexota bacterium]